MGLSKSKTKSTVAPTSYAQPYITAAGQSLNDAYGQSSKIAGDISGQISAQLPGLAEKAFGDNPLLTAANGYNSDVLSGKYLGAGNPYLSGQIAQTAADVTGRVQSVFSQAGRTGSGANQAALGRGLAAAEGGLHFQDYISERDRMGQAAALAPTLNQAQYSGLGAYLQAAQSSAGIPLQTASQYASGLGSLFSPYNTQTGTSSPSLGAILAQIGSNAARAYGGGG